MQRKPKVVGILENISGIRLQKLLARAGVASRRKCEELIAAGRVTVNGAVAETGAKARASDEIKIDGKPLKPAPHKKYIMLHKPVGVVTTVSDQFGRASVMDFAPGEPGLFPVGRLDYGTSGLLFLTNDGDWANALLHPSHKVEKTYIATVRGIPDEKKLQALRTGIIIDNRKTAPAEAEILQSTPPNSQLKIKIREGRNRQIRKMCASIGHPVIKLKRVAIGEIQLGSLEPGKWRYLTESEAALCMYR